MYSKRSGTSGIRGQLYATKLISLLYFRALHDDAVEEFQLASNIDNIGAFNDVCFKAKVKGFEKPVAVFIQAKHKENEKQTFKIDLASCFDSYLKIRKSFNLSEDDLLFKGAFEETECLFVVYTTAKNDPTSNAPVVRSCCSKLNDLIATCQLKPKQTATNVTLSGGTAMQPQKREENVDFLCTLAMKEQVTSLAERIACFIYEEEDFQMILSNELIQRYHVILGQKVFDISTIQPNGNRIAAFRHDFFDTNEEYLILFKNTLIKEILKRRTIEPADINKLLSEFLEEPTDAIKLSKVIGTVVTYSNGQLEFDKRYTNDLRPEINKYVSRSTVNKAMELAAKEILLSLELKVPAAFGNKDLTIRGSDVDLQTILNHLASKIIDLLDKSESSNMVTMDESVENGFLQLNGGLASAIGNIFVIDENTKLVKITDKWESLEDHAKKLFELLKLNDKIHNLQDYRFCLKVVKYPKLSFDFSEYEKNLATDFLNKLVFYSSQANEDGVETFLKSEIKEYQRDHPNYYQVKADAIFLKYHDEIQKWWMRPKQGASYLTRHCDLFQQAINNIIKDLLMCSINVTYMSKIKHYNYTFTEDAMKSLNIQDHWNTVIIAENTVLTVVKVIQYLKDKEHVVLDLEYIVNLPTKDRNALHTELKNTKKKLIFLCDKLRNSRNEKKTLENIAEAIQEKTIIVITNSLKTLEILKRYFPKPDNIVSDEKTSLIDMSGESQQSILENARVMFQGIEVRLDLIVDDKSKSYVKGDVLNKIINEETIVIGKQIVNRSYDEIKHLYMERRLRKTGENTDIHCKTFMDEIVDNVVLVTAEPGMGKSTLLTHLSLKTKELVPEVWIVRINLLEYSKEFSKWKEENTVIDSLETLKFMCQVILRDKLGNESNVEIELEEQNDYVYLKHYAGDQWTDFELKLFLHFYNRGKLIFAFDGFDEICPHYTNEVLRCLQIVSNGPGKQRMWITSRSYNEVKDILQQEFKSSYEIDYFSYVEMQKYLETFWERNLRLQELNSEQLDSVKNFIEYMSTLKDVKLYGFAMQLYSIYVNAAYYLSSEIKYKHIPLWIYKKNYDESFYFPVKDDLVTSFHKDRRDGNPLHLLLAATFVATKIKQVDNKTQIWNLEDNTFTFYERFLETKMKTIRFQEKAEMNICIADIIITCDRELQNNSLKHRKLAAYAVFNLHSHKLFSKKDLEEIKEMIKFIEKGGDKSGLVDNVADGIPVFILADYFAVEYICDCLKTANDSEKHLSWMDFVLNVMLTTESFTNIRNVFDYKIKIDKTLMNVLEKNDKAIFNLIMEQGRVYAEYIVNMCESHPIDKSVGRPPWVLSDAETQQLHNLTQFIVKILKNNINETNLNDFLDIAKRSQLLQSAYAYKNEVLITFVIDIVRNIDQAMFTSVLHDSFLFLTDSTICSYVELCTEDVVQSLLVFEDGVDSQPITSSTSSGFSSRPVTSSLPSRPSTSSLPWRPFIFNLPRRSSASSLPRHSSVSSMTYTRRRRSF